MNSRLKKIWQDIRTGQNLDVLVTILIAVAVAVLGIIGVTDQSIISSAILATLALVSVSLLLNRYRDEQIENALLRIGDHATSSESFLDEEFDRQALSVNIRKSRKAFLWGMTLWRTVPLLTESIEDGLKGGLEIRLLLIKPHSSAAKMAALRTTHGQMNKIDMELSANLGHLQNIARQRLGGKLEIRVIDYLAPWTMYAFDPHLPDGQMIVRLTPFRAIGRKRPSIRLSAKVDNKWFQYFSSQFESVWEEAELVSMVEE